MPVKLEVLPHQPNWHHEFERETAKLLLALGNNVVAIYHIGSTAIPQIYAKPIIDLLVEVNHLGRVDESNAAMQALGYEAKGEFGISGRRYFRKDTVAGVRTHQVHIFAGGSAEVDRHLAFRDYMIAHPADAQQYSELKRRLVATLRSDDIEGYMDGEDAFIKEMQKQALAWRALQSMRK
ncbi:MAG: GrpB family protein [Scytolyngbya sp. HA4215-MV1]|jgi:GrpB-like predicted nucleotidyltransferase (UPF0157 family)|nr:GrpB family protein [Scytolyngbya sp. HA4215-MV1]